MSVFSAEPSFTLGIEEEYLLVSLDSMNLIDEQPEQLMERCEALLGGQVTREFLRSQIEVGTQVHSNLREARDDLAKLRSTVIKTSNDLNLAPIAASSHPFARWQSQQPTQRDRYSALAHDLQGVARRMMICGMHIHVAIEDPQTRIDLMSQMAYFLPHLLALSTSSPFWEGDNLGLKSYRISVFDNLPRTGLPEYFDSYAEYERHVNILVHAGLIEDTTKLWWDIRPSARFPTLEIRIADVCTRLDDAISITALYRCLLRMLYRLRRNNQRWRRYANMLIRENRWRAQRYGVTGSLVDFGKGKIVPYAELLDELLELVREDGEYFDCMKELDHTRTIVQRGTSADNQVSVYEQALKEGASQEDALKAVVEFLVKATRDGLDID